MSLGFAILLGALISLLLRHDVAVLTAVTAEPPRQYFYLLPNNVAPPRKAPTQVLGGVHAMRFMDSDDDDLEATQFHSQDGDGRFAFGYSMPDQVRIESRDKDGSVRGSYSYLDPDGLTVKVQYWDVGQGFHSSGNNVPVFAPQPVVDTPEVQAAKEEHFRIYQQTLERNAAYADYLEQRRRREEAETDVHYDPPQNIESDEAVVVESEPHNPVDDKGNELKRYPQVQIPQNLFDPTQVHDQSLEAVIVENPDILGPSFYGNALRSAKKLSPEAPPPRRGFSYSFTHPVPTYLEVKTVVDEGDQYVKLDADELRSSVHQLAKSSLSQRAQEQGKIPVAAVHDAQVPPYQRTSVRNHQTLPVYLGVEDDDGRSGFRVTPPARTSLSLSERATYFGAIPVAAVHDAQVPPRMRASVRNHQVLPVYIEHGGQEN